jgi:hypothetical protein
MVTGDRAFIEESAVKMARALHQNGGFIAGEYGAWQDINVKEEWAGWAREAFMREAGFRFPGPGPGSSSADSAD